MAHLEIENRDDYYSFEDLSNIGVWDQAGKPIIYDIAEKRLADLEQQLLMIATYYIQKDTLASQNEVRVNGKRER